MSTQAALIAETIVGMKKALRRENEYTPPDDPITQPTNRGNKLKVNAKHVHEGALGFSNPHELYKEARYTRYILRRNPPRYDSEGEEIDDDDTDSEADATAAEANPFSEIILEEILCPLKQASELPDHPTMSQPYRSKALSTMIEAVKEKLRKERALLANSHNLHRQLLGDSVWMPCGYVESEEDKFIFQPRPVQTEWDSSANKKQGDWTQQDGNKETPQRPEGDSMGDTHTRSTTEDGTARNVGSDIEMAEAPNPENQQNPDTKGFKTEDAEQSVGAISEHSENVDARSWANDSQSYGEHTNSTRTGEFGPRGNEHNGNTTTKEPAKTGGSEEGDVDMTNADEAEDSKGSEGQASSPEPPRRMTTRAQANATTTHENGTASGSRFSSPDTSSIQIPSTHALFVVSEDIRPDKDFGLPPNEAEDTRRLLWSYIQKQEETVRGFTYMLDSLLRAQQLKDDVFEWCKAEGHVGELSDGEDWYDREKWGLAEGEDLKKGADEEDADNAVEEARTTAKRGRGRRQ
ncbi:hypothetical protein PISL3812_02659 [Talaromyces islandicus]|uniref:Transcriptional regulatory protein RXT2 N-terminal domain-containing protein n=1 Tax=Talaromyces islandicus TaxID=28573 RepID=A0A0U1LQI5_TALIS|nr:hypothetical protein PISL3812_02659 [Talaromyces islandicus]